MNTCAIDIAGIKIKFICPSLEWVSLIRKNYSAFIVPATQKSLDITIKTATAALSRGDEPEVVRNSDGWEIIRSDFHSSSDTGLNKTVLNIHKNKFSLNSWLRIFFTIRGLDIPGCLLHSAGYYHNGGTYLFAGVSGRGKSTITKILGIENALSDELVFIHKTGKNLIASGTPFWGELAPGTSNVLQGPLRGIFFLRHDTKLSKIKISHGEVVKRILSSTLFFSKEPKLINTLLSLAEIVAQKIPCHELSFSLTNTKKELEAILQ